MKFDCSQGLWNKKARLKNAVQVVTTKNENSNAQQSHEREGGIRD